MTSRSISSNLRSTSRLSKRSEVTLSNGSVHPSHMDRDPLIASILEAPILMKGDYPYLIHPLSDGVPRIEPELLDATLDRIEAVIDWTNVDLLLGIEAMGLPLSVPMALRRRIPVVIARKRPYGLEGEVCIDQTTGYGGSELYLNDLGDGERVLIIDDILSTGGTLRAVIEGVRRAGATVEHAVVLFDKSSDVEAISKELNVRITPLVSLDVDTSGVRVRSR